MGDDEEGGLIRHPEVLGCKPSLEGWRPVSFEARP
jgi:hypothetical protein